jgi:hypothetical protein
MLTEETVVDRIEIDERGTVSVRRATYILRDGVRLANPTFHRCSYTLGADVTGEHARVMAIAALVWSPAWQTKESLV